MPFSNSGPHIHAQTSTCKFIGLPLPPKNKWISVSKLLIATSAMSCLCLVHLTIWGLLNQPMTEMLNLIITLSSKLENIGTNLTSGVVLLNSLILIAEFTLLMWWHSKCLGQVTAKSIITSRRACKLLARTQDKPLPFDSTVFTLADAVSFLCFSVWLWQWSPRPGGRWWTGQTSFTLEQAS